MSDYGKLQSRCKRGEASLFGANNLLAECHAALGRLIAEKERQSAQFKEWQASHHANYCQIAEYRDQLKAENEALRREKSEPCDGCFMANAEALRKDAERYRWLKSRPVNAPTSGPDLAQWDDHQGDALRGPLADEAIDAAMGEGEQG